MLRNLVRGPEVVKGFQLFGGVMIPQRHSQLVIRPRKYEKKKRSDSSCLPVMSEAVSCNRILTVLKIVSSADDYSKNVNK